MKRRTFSVEELEIIQSSGLKLEFVYEHTTTGIGPDAVTTVTPVCNIYDDTRDNNTGDDGFENDDRCIARGLDDASIMVFILAYVSGREHGRQLAFGEVLDQEAERRRHQAS